MEHGNKDEGGMMTRHGRKGIEVYGVVGLHCRAIFKTGNQQRKREGKKKGKKERKKEKRKKKERKKERKYHSQPYSSL
jgi:hypothetical protein